MNLHNYGGDELNIVRQISINLACGSHSIVATVQVQASAPVALLIGTDVLPYLGVGTPSGAEIVVHFARRYLSSLSDGHVMVKLDFNNALNSIRRDKMLESVWELAPQIYPLVFSSYWHPSSLFFGSSCIKSEEGVQQGDPLGPLLFA